jgi:hypothetical protein
MCMLNIFVCIFSFNLSIAHLFQQIWDLNLSWVGGEGIPFTPYLPMEGPAIDLTNSILFLFLPLAFFQVFLPYSYCGSQEQQAWLMNILWQKAETTPSNNNILGTNKSLYGLSWNNGHRWWSTRPAPDQNNPDHYMEALSPCLCFTFPYKLWSAVHTGKRIVGP